LAEVVGQPVHLLVNARVFRSTDDLRLIAAAAAFRPFLRCRCLTVAVSRPDALLEPLEQVAASRRSTLRLNLVSLVVLGTERRRRRLRGAGPGGFGGG